VTRLPVSTTHPLVGAMVGAGVVLGPGAVAWASLVTKVAEPLLVSISVAYAGSAVLNLVPGRVPECVCVTDQPSLTPASDRTAAMVVAIRPALAVHTGTVADCRAHGVASRGIGVTLNGLHWLSGGAASFARGLNDTPKIVAVAAFALVPAGMRPVHLAAVVAIAMAAGGVVAGMRIARRLGDDVVAMDPVDGAKANLVSAALVGIGATHGLPISLTHVSTAAIAGAAGARPSRLNFRTLRDFALAWTVTPLVAGVVGAAAFLIIR